MLIDNLKLYNLILLRVAIDRLTCDEMEVSVQLEVEV